MGSNRNVLPVWFFFLPGVLFMLTAFIPLLKGRPINFVFFALAITWFLLGLAMAKNREESAAIPNGENEIQ